MELKHYLKILQTHWKTIVASAVALAVIVGVVSAYWPTRYKSELTVYVQRVPEDPPAGDYTYDGYYAQQAAEAYTDTVEGFLQSREIIRQALQASNLPTDAHQIRRVEKRLHVDKVAPQLIDVALTMETQAEASSLVKAIAQATSQRAKALNQQENEAVVIELVSAEPLESMVKAWVGLNVVVGLVGGLILSTGGVLLKGYLED